jgi:hypothetical protein
MYSFSKQNSRLGSSKPTLSQKMEAELKARTWMSQAGLCLHPHSEMKWDLAERYGGPSKLPQPLLLSGFTYDLVSTAEKILPEIVVLLLLFSHVWKLLLWMTRKRVSVIMSIKCLAQSGCLSKVSTWLSLLHHSPQVSPTLGVLVSLMSWLLSLGAGLCSDWVQSHTPPIRRSEWIVTPMIKIRLIVPAWWCMPVSQLLADGGQRITNSRPAIKLSQKQNTNQC